MKALLIVDVQKDFCPGGALAVPNGDEVVEPLNAIAGYALYNGWYVYASRDWHPRQTKHFKEFGGIWPVHCIQNTSGAEFHNDLRIGGMAAIFISKGTQPDENGYSAFDGHDDSRNESFLSSLQRHEITEVYVGGLATDHCVKASALDAAKLGFKTYLLLDTCRAVNINPGDGDRAVEEMKAAGVIMTTTEEVISGRI